MRMIWPTCRFKLSSEKLTFCPTRKSSLRWTSGGGCSGALAVEPGVAEPLVPAFSSPSTIAAYETLMRCWLCSSSSVTWLSFMDTILAGRSLPVPHSQNSTIWPRCSCWRACTMRRGSAISCSMTQLSWYSSALVAMGRSSMSLTRMGPLCPALAGGASSGGLLGGLLAAVLALAQLRCHRPRHEFVQPVAGVVGNAIEHVAQVGLRVDTAQLGRADQGVDHRSATPTAIGAQVQEVLASDRDASQRTLRRVVVRLDAAVVNEARERGPVAQRVADRHGHGRLRRDLCQRRIQPGLELL